MMENPSTSKAKKAEQSKLLASGLPESMKEKLLEALDDIDNTNFVETLPVEVQYRVSALETINEKRRDLNKNFLKELRLLERKYETLYKPLYLDRLEIVTGEREPTLAETSRERPQITTNSTKGVPHFWLNAMLNNVPFTFCCRLLCFHGRISCRILLVIIYPSQIKKCWCI